MPQNGTGWATEQVSFSYWFSTISCFFVTINCSDYHGFQPVPFWGTLSLFGDMSNFGRKTCRIESFLRRIGRIGGPIQIGHPSAPASGYHSTMSRSHKLLLSHLTRVHYCDSFSCRDQSCWRLTVAVGLATYEHRGARTRRTSQESLPRI